MMEADEDRLPVVPFVPWVCPECASPKSFTYGQRGRLRYHRCQECRCKYRSLQIDEDGMSDWARAWSPQPGSA